MKFRTLMLLATPLAIAVSGALAAPPETRPNAAAEGELIAAADAIGSMDFHKLYADKAYAAEILRHADRLASKAASQPEARRAVAGIRLLALDALDRDKEVLAAGKSLIAAGDGSPLVFGTVAITAAAMKDAATALTTIEAAARQVDGEEAAETRATLPVELIDWITQTFHRADDKASRQRLAEALLTLGWPEPDEMFRRDWLRVAAIDRRMAAGDMSGARKLALEVKGPAATIGLLTTRRYEPLFEPGEDLVSLIDLAVTRSVRYARERYEAEPSDWLRRLEYAQALRQRALEEEALALLLPASADLAKVKEGGKYALWVVNEAVLSLLAVGRSDEAVALSGKLLTLELDDHPELISMEINHGAFLNSAGRHREAAQAMASLEARAGEHASEFGYMWMWSNAACGHALSGDKAGAAPWLAKLAAKSKENEPAHLRALLCSDDLAAAEPLLIRMLRGDDADQVLVLLQDYRLGEPKTAAARLIQEKIEALRDRPAVDAEIRKAGRILQLPLSETVWGI